MSDETQTMLHAVPLLALAVLYGLLSILLGISLVRERRTSWFGVAIWLLFALVAAFSGLLGGLALADQDVFEGEPTWLVVGGPVAVAIPGLIMLVRGHDRSLLFAARRRVREAEEFATERGREAEAIARLSATLSRTHTAEEAVESLFDEVDALLEPDALLLARVDEQARRAYGFASRGVDAEWWTAVSLDLDEDTGAVVQVARTREAVSIYDVPTAPNVNRQLAEAVGAKSGAFIPLITEGRVAGVLVVVSREAHRHFADSEVDVVQGMASEAALVVSRTRSNEALRAALERERLVAEIGRRVRSELDLDTVLRVAVEETAKAIGVTRCFIRLGERGEPMPVLAEWDAPGVGPVGDAAPNLPALNLAARDRRTVAVTDVAADSEIRDPSLGSPETLLSLGARSTLATPILVFDRMIGVFGLHRADPIPWDEGEIALAEAVARELGLAIHTARLLGENKQRLRQQETLIKAAQVLTSDLHFESVITRLVREVVSLIGADAADCWILEPDRKLLRCRAVVGVPEWNVGRQIPPEGTIGRTLRSGRTVVTHDFATTERPPPSPPYAVFSDVMCAPIMWLGEVRGILGVCDREPGRFEAGDVEVIEAFARFASLALHNAESFEERERQAQVQRGFYRIAEVLGSPLSLSETLAALAQAASEALGGAAAFVLERTGETVVLAGAHELPDTIRDRFAAGFGASAWPFPIEPGEGRILASSELSGDDRFDSELRKLLAAEGYGSLICTPVTGVREQAYAGVVLFHGARSFTDEDVLLTRHVSDAARGALERSELFESERRARMFSQRLARLGTLLGTSLDPAVVLQEVAREAPGLLDADAAVIRLLDGDDLVVRATHGVGTERLAATTTNSSTGLSGAVVQARAPRAVRDGREQPRLSSSDDLLEGSMTAAVAVPMIAHGSGLYGVLAVYARTPRSWREDEVESLAALAASASASIANAELYQRVAEERERAAAILANIADGIVAVGRDNRIVLWNAMAEHITGVPASEALGRLVPEVLQRELAAGESEPPGERYLAVRRGGNDVWIALSEAVMVDPSGAVAGRIFAFRDVSSERVVEQMKSDFVSTVSHELRTPLTSIYGFAETLMRSDVDFSDLERQTFLRYIASESERLIGIVDDLLNVARLEAGTLAVALEPTDLANVAREAADGVQAHTGEGHRFAVAVEPGEIIVHADREKLGQVLSALLANAVSYSPEGGTITISARRRADMAEIEVADEGVGIARADLQRIFMRFFRAEREGVTAQGTGLGLFLVRGLVTAMGGRIWVESDEGQGSRFTFELPLAGGEPAEGPRVEAAAAP